jgi:glycosyltransferase A (GT-A) superfamily protein (DUF2064 family)
LVKGRAPHVLVLAKAPVPGQVKTRLCPPCTPERAAAIAAAALADTLDAVAACGAPRKILALAGEPGPWLPPGFTVIEQRGRDFRARLINAWIDAGGPGVQIGMDTPQVRPDELDRAVDLAVRHAHAAVLGPAGDGGWWLIGWAAANPAKVFAGVPLSTAQTGLQQARRLRDLGLDLTVLRAHRDIDTVTDLGAVATTYPDLRTAAVLP